ELNWGLPGGFLHTERAAVSKNAIDPRPAVAVAQLGVQGDNFVNRRLEIRKVFPWQLELDFRAVRCSPRADFDPFAGNCIKVVGPQAPPRLDLGLVVAGPVHMDGALAPVEAAEIFVAAGVKI